MARRLFGGAAVAAMLMGSTSVLAQTAPGTATQNAASPAEGDATGAEDIVVVGTAGGGTRRQDASFAVTTLNSDAIRRAAPSSTADVLRAVPGISVESSGGQNGANIFVRGYPSGGDAQFVTFQMGGVPIFPPPTLSFLENSQLIRLDETVQRVEAVRGGTGSLFSNGQPGLTVNVVPREGSQVFHGFVKGSYTDYDEARGDAWISGPISDDTTFMVGGYYARGNGIRDPRFRAEEGGQVTANLHHDFGTRGSFSVNVRYLNDHGQWLLPIPVVQNGTSISQYRNFSTGTGTLMGTETRITTNNAGQRIDLADGRGAKVGNIGFNFDYEFIDNLRVRERMSYLWGSANTVGLVPTDAPMSAAAMAQTLGGSTATVGSLSFVNGGGAPSADMQVMRAGIWSVQKEIDSFVNDFGLELKTGRNKLTGGFYFADYKTRDNWSLGNNVLLTAEPNGRLLNMTLSDGRIATRQGFTSGASFLVNGLYKGRDYAFYAVDELQITDQLRIDGGVRWQRHEVDGNVLTSGNSFDADGNPATLYDTTVALSNTTNIRYRANKWSWTAGANYDFTSQLGVFARFSRGHSFPQFDDLRDGLTQIAKVDTYEGGVKLSMPMVNLYATVFHNKFDGLATTQIINGVPNTQLGGAKATGVEVEGTIRPFAGFSLTASGTYLDGTYRNYFTNNGLIDNTGHRVQRQPKWMWRVTPSYELEVGGVKPSLYATLQYTGDRFGDPENQQLLPHYYQLDAGVSVEVNEHLRVAATGNNLTNEIGLTEGNPRIIGSQGSGTILARPILGRSFRFSVSYGF